MTRRILGGALGVMVLSAGVATLSSHGDDPAADRLAEPAARAGALTRDSWIGTPTAGGATSAQPGRRGAHRGTHAPASSAVPGTSSAAVPPASATAPSSSAAAAKVPTTPAPAAKPSAAAKVPTTPAPARAGGTTTQPGAAPGTRGATPQPQQPAPVQAAAPVAAPSTGSSAPRGDLPGWRQVYADDFSTPATWQQVPSAYPRITEYPDGTGNGTYQAENLSVSGGSLNIALQRVGSQGQGAAFTITNPSSGWGQRYGRYSIRFRADALPGFSTAMMLWPSSNTWSEGETDFAEGEFTGTVHAFNHQVGADPQVNSLAVDTGARWTDWHTATVDWTPTAVRIYLDDKLVGTDTKAVSQSVRHWVVQACEYYAGAASASSGAMQIDWVALYEYAG